jgi:spore germination protein YaaH
MKLRYLFFVLLTCCFVSCATPARQENDAGTQTTQAWEEEAFTVTEWSEVWAYLLDGSEKTLLPEAPLTDVGYFGAEVDSYGVLTAVPNRKKIVAFDGRVHLVVTCNSRGLTHFALEPASAVRKKLVADLIAASEPYDGLQIDFELVPAKDGERFLSFLAELRMGLRDKMLTVALPARTRTIADDVYNYEKIAALVDRILIMAYDEHWSTSEPGPIASLAWCEQVAAYAKTKIQPEKLIMGLPFYGRTWGSINTFRAFFHEGIERIKKENNVKQTDRAGGIPHFTYEIPVTVTVFYEDAASLTTRLAMYRSLGIEKAGFWCLGQEDPSVWQYVRKKNGN